MLGRFQREAPVHLSLPEFWMRSPLTIRSPIGRPARTASSVLAALLVASVAAGGAASAADPDINPSPDPGGTTFDPLKPPKVYSPVPTSPTDHFVGGKYDKTGTYIPPHYEPVSKPAFHGYFYKPKPKPKKDQFGNPIPDTGASPSGAGSNSGN